MRNSAKPKNSKTQWKQISINALVAIVTLVLLGLSVTWSLIM